MKLVRAILPLLILIALAAESERIQKQECQFTALVKSEGWDLPKHGEARTRRAVAELEHYPKLKNIYRSDFGEAGSMSLPQYWVQNRSLMLYSYDFRLTALHGYDVNGKAFRYLAEARGMSVGAALTPSWTDRDGDGTFEEYRSGGGHALDNLPQWVLNEVGN